MRSLSESNSFLSPPVSAIRNSRDGERHDPPDSDSCFVPMIRIERPSSPVSLSSQLSSEPLDSVLWGQQDLYLSLEEFTRDTSRSTSECSSNAENSSYASSFHSQSLPSPTSGRSSPALNEDPPDYTTTVQIPTVSVQYDFSTTSYNSMIVSPSGDPHDSRPKYHISITMNCFMPLSHISTIRRGGSGYGQFVAQFEMGIAQSPSTVTINGTQALIASVLSKRAGTRSAGLWYWTPPNKGKRVLWDCRISPFVCRSMLDIGSGREESLLANFTPAGHGQPPSTATLIVNPKGQNFFDDLLLSLLIIERKRLTPGKDKVLKQLFN